MRREASNISQFFNPWFRFWTKKTLDQQILPWTTIRISNKGGEVRWISSHPRSTWRSCIDCPCFWCKKKGLSIDWESELYFNCVTGYPPDILHDIFVGIVPLELGLCFSVFISKKYFTYSELNTAMSQFPYKWADKTNYPQPVPATFSSRKRIGGMKIGPRYGCCHLLLDTEYLWMIHPGFRSCL